MLSEKRKLMLLSRYVFSGIDDIYEYIEKIDDTKTASVRKCIENKLVDYLTFHNVKFWNENHPEDISCGTMYCFDNKIFVKTNDSMTITSTLPCYCPEIDKNGENLIVISPPFSTYYQFKTADELKLFYDFAVLYDKRSEFFEQRKKELFSQIEQETTQYELIDGITDMIQNFLDMLNEVFFIEPNGMWLIVQQLCFSDIYFTKYIDVQISNATDQPDYSDYDLGLQLALSQSFSLLCQLKELLESEFQVNPKFVGIVVYNLLIHGLVTRYSAIWNNEYDNTFCQFNSIGDYIPYLVNNDIITKEDTRGIAALTYFYMANKANNFVSEQSKILRKIEKAEDEKAKISFKNQLLKPRDTPDAINKPTINDVDLMDGVEFENFICDLFKKMGYVSSVTPATGDQGIDVIAEKNIQKIGIQAKCYSNTVGNSAVQEAVAGKAYYNCNKVIVVTNNYFTQAAIDLASANNVVLWNRDILKEKIMEIY